MIGELTQKEIADFLSKHSFGHLGCNDGSKTYVFPMSYIYFSDYILCHSRGGRKIEIMRRHPQVCFQIDEIKDFSHWQSLIVWGTYEEIKDADEFENAKKQFINKPLDIKFSLSSKPPNEVADSRRIEKAAMTELVFYKINITEISSRYELGHPSAK